MVANEERPAELAAVPPPLTLRRGMDGHLRASRGEDERVVHPKRCFPWTDPKRYISLRDDDDEEIALVVDPADLEPQSKEVLEDALREAGFLFEVDRIIDVKEEFEIRAWVVMTRQGQRSFQTARDAWPQELPSGDFLVRDVAGDLYCITATARADRDSQKHLFAFVD